MKYKNTILKSIEYIEKNIKENLTLKDISNYVCYSEFHFSRIFKNEMGISIMDYVQERRLLLASKEIINGKKIIDVSIDYCYETHSGFTKSFKKKFGFTPTEHLFYVINLLNSIIIENGDDLKMTNDAHVFIKPSIDFTSQEILYKQLIESIKKNFSSIELSEIDKAYKLSCDAHKDQYRKSTEPYIIHPLNVALILSELKVDKETLIVGLLHDVIEKNTCLTLDKIELEFTTNIKKLLEKVTNFTMSNFNGETDNRVFIIKLADRLHNMRTIKYMDPKLYIEKSKETIEFFSPLATKLNIQKFKRELEDLSINYISKDDKTS